jgi:DnaK suppressor protein
VPEVKAAKGAKLLAKKVAKKGVKKVAVAASKPSPKPVAKSPVKAGTKPASKPLAKSSRPAAKPVEVKVQAAKPVSPSKTPSSAKAAPVVTTKAAARPSTPALAPQAPKAVSKVKSSTTPAKPAAPASPQAMTPAPQPTASPTLKTMLPPPPALKPGRRSSARTASQSPPPAPMIPTHAPDAAKASYSTITERVISPPPHVAAKKDPKLANNWKTKEPRDLTDEEVKAMPDSEYMNETQLAFFRHKLSLLKQEIHASAGETTEHLREDTVVVPDPADRATIEEEHALELRTRDRERKLLKKIEQSIARIDAGDYGYCDETGEAIGVGRLIARPTASLSLEAQQRRELKQKMFGD